eukprot:jgi/Undpi1/6793/HiC_scaffold_21.g09269.m1
MYRAACDALDNYLDVPSPLTEDTTITLTVDVIECEGLDADTNSMEVEQIVVEGGTLTIASDDTVQFINVAFLVMSGAALVFDMPETIMGPNSDSTEDYPSGTLLEIGHEGSMTFNGDVTIEEIENVNILVENYGTMEFEETALIQNNVNGIAANAGTIKFRGDTTIKRNYGIGVSNNGGFVRFSTTVAFDYNGSQLEGFSGCDIENHDDSTMSFRGDATFSNTNCWKAEGVSLYNTGTMNFYGKAGFSDNTSRGNGGAVLNSGGSMTFRRAVQFNDNDAGDFGGGIALEGGDVTFKKGVKFSGNVADSGAAFAVLSNGDSDVGTLTFKKPSAVSFEGNTVDVVDDNDDNCTVGEVEEGSILIGYPDDDVCVAATQNATCSPVRKRATRGRLRPFTQPNLGAHETGRACSRYSFSRRGEPQEAGSGDKTEGGAPYVHPDPPTKWVDSSVRAEKKTDQPPPDSGASRRQLSPALGERNQLPPTRSTGNHRRHLGSPCSTERHPQSSRDQGGHAAPLDFAYAAARARQAFDDPNWTIARQRQFNKDIEQAKTAARESSLVPKRAHQVFAHSAASAAAGAIAAPSPSSRPQGVASQRARPGNEALFKGFVAPAGCLYRREDGFLRVYASESGGLEARNLGFGLASCSRSLVLPQEDTAGPKRRGLVLPKGDVADPQMSNEATDGLAPSVFAIFRAQLERILARFRQRAKKDPRRDTTGSDSRRALEARGS